MIKNKELLARIISAIVSFLLFGLLWELVATFTKASSFLPQPIVVLKSFFEHFVVPIGKVTLSVHVMSSLKRVLIGYVIASAVAVLLGITMAMYKMVDAVVSPLFNMIRPIPPVAWIPLAILWFGIGDASKYFLIFLATFISVLQNAYAGAKSADPQLIGAAKMLGANDFQTFSTIILPNAFPYIFSGLQLGLTAAWGQVVASEMIRSSEGVGWIIIRGMDNNDIVQEMVGIITIGIVGFVLAAIMRGVESKLCRWAKR